LARLARAPKLSTLESRPRKRRAFTFPPPQEVAYAVPLFLPASPPLLPLSRSLALSHSPPPAASPPRRLPPVVPNTPSHVASTVAPIGVLSRAPLLLSSPPSFLTPPSGTRHMPSHHTHLLCTFAVPHSPPQTPQSRRAPSGVSSMRCTLQPRGPGRKPGASFCTWKRRSLTLGTSAVTPPRVSRTLTNHTSTSPPPPRPTQVHFHLPPCRSSSRP